MDGSKGGITHWRRVYACVKVVTGVVVIVVVGCVMAIGVVIAMAIGVVGCVMAIGMVISARCTVSSRLPPEVYNRSRQSESTKPTPHRMDKEKGRVAD